jgi:hypothetical protein
MDEREWNMASSAERDRIAEDAGLIRVSSFSHHLPYWHELPENWRQRLASSAEAPCTCMTPSAALHDWGCPRYTPTAEPPHER